MINYHKFSLLAIITHSWQTSLSRATLKCMWTSAGINLCTSLQFRLSYLFQTPPLNIKREANIMAPCFDLVAFCDVFGSESLQMYGFRRIAVCGMRCGREYVLVYCICLHPRLRLLTKGHGLCPSPMELTILKVTGAGLISNGFWVF